MFEWKCPVCSKVLVSPDREKLKKTAVKHMNLHKSRGEITSIDVSGIEQGIRESEEL